MCFVLQLILKCTVISKKPLTELPLYILTHSDIWTHLFVSTGLPQGASSTLTAKLHSASTPCCALPVWSKLITLLNLIVFAVIWFTEGSVGGLFHYGPISPYNWIHFPLYPPSCFQGKVYGQEKISSLHLDSDADLTIKYHNLKKKWNFSNNNKYLVLSAGHHFANLDLFFYFLSKITKSTSKCDSSIIEQNDVMTN